RTVRDYRLLCLPPLAGVGLLEPFHVTRMERFLICFELLFLLYHGSRLCKESDKIFLTINFFWCSAVLTFIHKNNLSFSQNFDDTISQKIVCPFRVHL